VADTLWEVLTEHPTHRADTASSCSAGQRDAEQAVVAMLASQDGDFTATIELAE
jgi:hypothetical protein